MQSDRLLKDTSSKAEVFLLDRLRQAPAQRKFKMVGDHNAAVRLLAVEGIRASHLEATEDEVKPHLADFLWGEELAAKLYGEKDSANAA